jgi:hypothetical protein
LVLEQEGTFEVHVNGDLPPIEPEQAHYRQTTGLTQTG